jgi:hypothetical protein
MHAMYSIHTFSGLFPISLRGEKLTELRMDTQLGSAEDMLGREQWWSMTMYEEQQVGFFLELYFNRLFMQ